MNKVCVVMLFFFVSLCYAAESKNFCTEPYSIYKKAAEKLLAHVPEQMKSQQKLSSEVLANQLERIVPKRVENHTLIEDILYQCSPLQSEGTALLLLQIGNVAAIESGSVLQEKQKKD